MKSIKYLSSVINLILSSIIGGIIGGITSLIVNQTLLKISIDNGFSIVINIFYSRISEFFSY